MFWLQFANQSASYHVHTLLEAFTHLSPELFLVYGLSFIILGVVALIQPSDPRNLPSSRHIWLLGLFGVLHGTSEIYDSWLVTLGEQPPDLVLAGSFLLVLSYLPLLEFGRRLLQRPAGTESAISRIGLGPWLHAMVLGAGGLLVLALWSDTEPIAGPIGVAARYLIAFPGALAASIGLARDAGRKFWATWLLSASLFAYALLGGLVVEDVATLPAFVLTQSEFNNTFGVPVQLCKMISALVAMISLLIMVRRSARQTVDEAYRKSDELEAVNRDLEKQILDRTEDLRESERRLKKAERIARIGYWSSSPAGELHWSERTMELFGVDPAAFPGTVEFFYSLVHPDDLDMVRAAMAKARTDGTEYSCVHRVIRPDGQVRIVRETAEFTDNADESTDTIFGIVQDITESAEIEEQLRQAQKLEAIGTMTGGVAHDFNNLLAVILGNLELAQDATNDPKVGKHLQTALEATIAGSDLTRKMLSFARRARLDPQILDLNQIVRNTRSWSARVLPETIEIETSLLAGLWTVEADANSTESAILNLLLNARDAMQDGGHITIETANMRIDNDYLNERGEEIVPGRYVMLAVSDTGAGIPADQIDRIFEPFFTTKGPGQGSGLGLAMVHGFMRQSGGTIRVYSEVGKGTTFKLYFRAANAGKPAHPVKRPEIAAKATDAVRILVAEDQTSVMEALAATLEGAGYGVLCARNGDEARELFLEAGQVDLVLTDIVMPGTLQGPALAKALREVQPSLPVVFISGYANEATVHGNGLRPEDIRLMKPVTRTALIETCERALAAVR